MRPGRCHPYGAFSSYVKGSSGGGMYQWQHISPPWDHLILLRIKNILSHGNSTPQNLDSQFTVHCASTVPLRRLLSCNLRYIVLQLSRSPFFCLAIYGITASTWYANSSLVTVARPFFGAPLPCHAAGAVHPALQCHLVV